MEQLSSVVANLGVLALGGLALTWLATFLGGRPRNLFGRLAFGAVLGVVSLWVIHYPIPGLAGSTFDTRAGPVVLAGYYGGPLGGLVAAAIGASARLSVGGAMKVGGSLSFLVYAGSGILFRWMTQRMGITQPQIVHVFLLAILATASVVPCFFVGVPFEVGRAVLVGYWHVLALGNVLGTVTLFFILDRSLASVALTALLRMTVEELREREARLRQAARIARLGYFVVDAQTLGVEECSATHAAHFGLDPQQFRERVSKDMGPVAFLHPDDRDVVRRSYQQLARGEAVEHEYRVIREGAEPTHVREVVEPLSEPEEPASKYIGTSLDLTELRRAELQLLHAQKMEAVGGLTAGVAHDFNNLLTVITANLGLLREQPFAPENPQIIIEALQAAERGAELTEKLLAFGRRARLEPVELDPHAVIVELVALLRRTFRGSIILKTDLAPDCAYIRVDRSQLEVALLNLAINARDALPEGGTLTIGAENREVEEPLSPLRGHKPLVGRYVVLRVEDDGSGMPPHVLERAFEPFFTTKAVGEGSGLGLPMVYGFSNQSGGDVRISSQVGRGTRVELFFPAVESPNAIRRREERA